MKKQKVTYGRWHRDENNNYYPFGCDNECINKVIVSLQEQKYPVKNEFEIIALEEHYGILTPFSDWSEYSNILDSRH